MKLEERVENIRLLIWKSFDKRLQQLGLMTNKEYDSGKIIPEFQEEKKKIKYILTNFIAETGDYIHAREKLIDELSFTLFNRIAGIKVMESHTLIPEVFTKDEAHGGRSFGHQLWLEQNPDQMGKNLDGLSYYVRYEFLNLADRIHLYSPDYLYDMLPDLYDLNNIINGFNQISKEEWRSDDIMGWLYESYNRKKRQEFKDSGEKIEYNWVSLTSQIYTPRWVVEFILNNSLGKLWMEMHPDSKLKDRHDIANVPNEPTLKPKQVEEIKVLDPAVGSGNFLLYAFDLLYEMYLEEGKIPEADIPRKIVENNLFGIDLDDRAIQIAQLGLYIKAMKKNKDVKLEQINVVSADFYLPEYEKIEDFFIELRLHQDSRDLLKSIWNELRLAHKFGSLIRIEEHLLPVIQQLRQEKQLALFKIKEKDLFDQWEILVIPSIKNAIEKYAINGNTNVSFFQTKTIDSLTYIEILQKKFDIVVANPPYTDAYNYGAELKNFILHNYKSPLAFHPNLFATFLKRNTELLSINGKTGIIHPLTFMYIKSFEDMRKYILSNYHIHLFVEFGLSDLFGSVMADPAIYILEKGNYYDQESIFISMNQYTRTPEENLKEKYTKEALSDYINNRHNKNIFLVNQSKFNEIKSSPFIYWISDEFREKFKSESIEKILKICSGLSTANNHKFLRFWWEIDKDSISENYKSDKRKWVKYAKGGEYNKWYGNIWLTINYFNDGNLIKKNGGTLRNKEYYFKEGLTCSGRSSTKGVSYRILPPNHIFDVGATGLISVNKSNIYYALGFMNSSLISSHVRQYEVNK